MPKRKQIKSGESLKEAIIINARNDFDGVMAEYAYLDKKFGIRGKDWELDMQSLIEEGGKIYDKMDLKFSDGSQKTIYFDITSFFGKLWN